MMFRRFALAGSFVGLTGAFLFTKNGKISAHFWVLKSGHNPGKRGHSKNFDSKIGD